MQNKQLAQVAQLGLTLTNPAVETGERETEVPVMRMDAAVLGITATERKKKEKPLGTNQEPAA